MFVPDILLNKSTSTMSLLRIRVFHRVHTSYDVLLFLYISYDTYRLYDMYTLSVWARNRHYFR